MAEQEAEILSGTDDEEEEEDEMQPDFGEVS